MTRMWKNNRGETLVEVLASILICTLSVTLLFSAVMASVRMDKNAEAADEVFLEGLNKAERQKPANPSDPSDPGDEVTGAAVTVRYIDKSVDPPAIIKDKTIAVTFYGGKGALSYKLP